MATTDVAIEEEGAPARAAEGVAERSVVRAMFSAIAPRYDLLNHLLSLNLDRRWRRRAIRELRWEQAPHGTYVDLCAGTLDVAAALARRPGFGGRVLGADFAEPMLRAGRGKAPARVVSPVVADALGLPLASGTAAGAIVAFGIRNVSDLDAGLREVHRVLAPGARLVILEFTTPRQRIVWTLYRLYFHHVLPFVGGVVSGNRAAYRYLPASVARFPNEPALAERLRAAGFADVHWTSLTLGIAAIHVGTRR
jgi:demethylmenaquinone methyltransferase/2-methoxy-6-polyprenyl-1,4-benzoquinol methylase